MAQVSVVLIFLDAERFIGEAIDSARGQSLSDWELILVDDGSSDESTAIAKRAAEADPRIRYVEHPSHANRGMSASRNLGAAQGTAPYLAFLDADDRWEPNKLAEQVALLEGDGELALTLGALLYWYSWDPAAVEPDRLVLTGGIADRRLEPPEAALQLYPLGTGAGAGLDVLVRRSAFEAVDGFEERFRGLYEDQAFLLKIFLRYPVFISSRPWLRYRQHDASCCATTTRSPADYRRLRMDFLRWLATYLDRQSTLQPKVRRALWRAQRRLRLEAARDLVKKTLRRLASGGASTRA
ncbi:glycosyltransferase family A protein [uncultured Sphingomonas sp.]|uniref:glycosyltransferase family 2 protein n=1 Tax=uncultured Sphingomonas sp. TaxID=158754 RepID=UPI002600B2B3|nr:glycosyltransferase family A protein [uncultured Sphingomonas sp.]